MSAVNFKSWGFINKSTSAKAGSGNKVKIHILGRGQKLPKTLLQSAPSSEKKNLKEGASLCHWSGNRGETWVIQLKVVDPNNHYGLFTPSPFSMARDLVGACFRQILAKDPAMVSIEHLGESEEELMGVCVGIEMGQYQFKNHWPKPHSPSVSLSLKSNVKNHKKIIQKGGCLGEAVNLSRFLIDLPGNALQPTIYAETLKALFDKKAFTKVNIWNGARLKKEKMGLHSAVGQAAPQEPNMVHIQYRGGEKEKPLAFIGKGITFDAGGLDIKPAVGMRLMKKDMGGSASVAGLAWWVVNTKQKINCDFYFAIAENSTGSKSFRPGDILQARNGMTVEIHNTDAEGRLVLADVITVAAEAKPQMLIDIATLTGAIKVGLGSGTPGMFSNSDNLAETLTNSSQIMGDQCWRMPLVPEERARLKSPVADVVNCTDGYGGSVTAALFLEKFVKGLPWAHFDIYGWVDKAKGPYGARGGSGQMVQALSHFVENQAN